jgi:hypothetical protein
MLTPTDWAYIASMLDGDGCIYMGFAKTTNKKGTSYKAKGKVYYRNADKTYERPSLQISVTNCHFHLIQWIQVLFGGKYYWVKKKKDSHKAKWSWRCLRKDQQEIFLMGILPYLKEKRGQAELALQWVRLSGKHHAERHVLAEKCQELNARESVTTNTSDNPYLKGLKIESELTGNSKSAPTVTLDA